MLDTPVLFVIFNRLDTTRRVFEAIRKVKPKQLFIGADGPRSSKEGEAAECELVQASVVNGIDWECEVHTLFQEKNLGSGPAVYKAIDWFFSKVEKGIIIEDDCLPLNSFFEYAEAVLDFYESDERVMHVSACNLQCGIRRGNASFYFSKIAFTWGWATWRRAWHKYSFDFYQHSNEEIRTILKKTISNKDDVESHVNEFQHAKDKAVSAWDFQWIYTIMVHNGICITPQYNLIENLGFGSHSTHTFAAPYWYKYLINRSVAPIVFPKEIIVNKRADIFTYSLMARRRNIESYWLKIINNPGLFVLNPAEWIKIHI